MGQKIGILAYGSLINDLGKEIEPLIIDRIACFTPFAIEYARLSSTRDDAPSLIPVKEGGAKVKAQILVLGFSTFLTQAEDMLWRRETRQKTNVKLYPRNKEPGKNSVTVIRIDNFEGVDQVIYTSIPSNISLNSPDILAGLAVQSILQEAGERKIDGVRYLLDAKRNGIKTLLSEAYEQEILKQTETKSLEAAIEKLDALRTAQLERAAAFQQQELQYLEFTKGRS
ncbi:hypothetical protein BDE36_2061 [Arcticibacter tournemirensis]|uniref:Gamma-glutamylcyclotransferase n=1 Tax=Arcticibacter tournemirensis TaxID=699437 RepID=A0A5M9HF17_9SPHI|nr:hypothetical protein [Arcticibacter tournemirensis]KAA8485390.1 hypothetical protein F1649_04540 [Arcticibacter tournemirensis]TQM50318.1 hypothetical protein BDE36_2061 [Arcticibacter tournemirensis]